MTVRPAKKDRSKKKQKVTLTELARQLDLSICTVSKILNRSFERVSYADATIRRVNSAAKRLGYSPNVHARSLRTNRSMTIAVVVPEGIPYFSGSLVEQLETELRPKGYVAIAAHSTADSEAEKRLVASLLDRGVDGILWVPFGRSLTPKNFLLPDGFPLIQLDRPGGSRAFPAVLTDNFSASEALARRIAESGHRNILVLTSLDEDDSLAEREAGVRQIFAGSMDRLLSPAANMEIACEVVSRAMDRLRGRVLVGLSQPLSLGALLALQRHGLQIGRDVGFASFDSLPLCEIWHPSLCRIEQDIPSLGAEAVRLLLEKVEGRPLVRVPQIRIPGRLIWGTSVPSRTDLASAFRKISSQ